MIKCWKTFSCGKTECPAYDSASLTCWLVSGTHCRNEVQGEALAKMDKCLECEVLKTNLDTGTMVETITVAAAQFRKKAEELQALNQQLNAGEQQLKAANQLLSAREQALIAKVAETEQFNRIMVSRELAMIELKQRINTLLSELGKPKEYEGL
jgi:hypothetical protein